MDEIKKLLSIVSLVVLVVSLGAAGTSLGLINANTYSGMYCNFFVSNSQARNESLYNYNIPTCKLSIATATIATICLAMLTASVLHSRRMSKRKFIVHLNFKTDSILDQFQKFFKFYSLLALSCLYSLQ